MLSCWCTSPIIVYVGALTRHKRLVYRALVVSRQKFDFCRRQPCRRIQVGVDTNLSRCIRKRVIDLITTVTVSQKEQEAHYNVKFRSLTTGFKILQNVKVSSPSVSCCLLTPVMPHFCIVELCTMCRLTTELQNEKC